MFAPLAGMRTILDRASLHTHKDGYFGMISVMARSPACHAVLIFEVLSHLSGAPNENIVQNH